MEETVTPSYLLSLPYELQQNIAMGLDIKSTLNLCLGAKSANAVICKDDGFWRAKYRQDFDTGKVFDELNWFENYRIKSQGTITFDYDTDNNSIYIKKNDRTFTTIPNIDEQEELLRRGFLGLFHYKGLGPVDVLRKLDEGLSIQLNSYVDFEKNTDLSETGEYVIKIRNPDSDRILSFIYLTKIEAKNLITTFYEDFYIAFYM